MKISKSLILCLLILIGLLAACSDNSPKNSSNENNNESTSDFPKNQISLVVPFASGGASDLVSRTIASEMEKELGVPVVVSNITGGTGSNGLFSVQNAKADGYTIGYAPVEFAMLENLGLAEIKPENFSGIGKLMTIPAALTVNSDAPYDTVEEFITYVKENGNVKIGNSGTGSIWHIAAGALADEAKIKVTHVPYDGAAPAITALMGKHIDAVTVSPSEVKSGLDSGDLKLIGMLTKERNPNFPDTPTFSEAGYDIDISAWGGFIGPANIPENHLSIIQNAFEKATNSQEFKTLLDERGMTGDFKNGNEFITFVNEQYDYFKELIPSIDLN